MSNEETVTPDPLYCVIKWKKQQPLGASRFEVREFPVHPDREYNTETEGLPFKEAWTKLKALEKEDESRKAARR